MYRYVLCDDNMVTLVTWYNLVHKKVLSLGDTVLLYSWAEIQNRDSGTLS